MYNHTIYVNSALVAYPSEITLMPKFQCAPHHENRIHALLKSDPKMQPQAINRLRAHKLRCYFTLEAL